MIESDYQICLFFRLDKTLLHLYLCIFFIFKQDLNFSSQSEIVNKKKKKNICISREKGTDVIIKRLRSFESIQLYLPIWIITI